MKTVFKATTSVLLLTLVAACTAPDGELLITKPGCGLIACGSTVSDYYGDKIETRRNTPTARPSPTRFPTTYRRSGNVVYGSDGTICRKSEGSGTVYCN